jgi:predicted signal transduction protein with EAL and GGDEF domain
LSSVGAPLTLSEHKINIPSFAGIACYPQHEKLASELIKYADIAAGDATHEKHARFGFYDHNMTQRALLRLALESELREAIAADELELNLQGKFSTDGQLVGAEALTRWHHPQRGSVSPGDFVPLAEESDLILNWMPG